MKKSDPRWNDESTTSSCGNVFVDLGFHYADAEVMQMRVELAVRIAEKIKENKWTQIEAAHQLDVAEHLTAQIISGASENLSLENLLVIAVKAGLKIRSPLSNSL